MEEKPDGPDVVWMPAFAMAVVLALFTYFVPLAGAVIGALALVGVIVRAPRRGWTPLTWVCLGTAIGAAVIWALIALHSR
ncbi:MAG: hypothetical protein QM638_18145 [Nocardioides sp.]|uniref:hypothetical protein n=1 Tax=Nocardioides sp. TaxID=35761 RepID=UPI0039E5E07F